MGDKTIVDSGASVTEFDAENILTEKEKKRDGLIKSDAGKTKKK